MGIQAGGRSAYTAQVTITLLLVTAAIVVSYVRYLSDRVQHRAAISDYTQEAGHKLSRMQRKTGSGHPGRTSPSGISERVTVEEYHTSTNNMRPIDGVLGESPSAREAVRSKERQSMKGITDSAKNTAGVFDVSMLASGEINSGRDIFYSLLPRIFSSSNAEIVWNDSGPLGLKFDELGREAITRKLGFRRGDIIQRINGQEIISPRSLRTIAPAAAAGFLEIVVLRDGEPHKIEIDLAHAIGRF